MLQDSFLVRAFWFQLLKNESFITGTGSISETGSGSGQNYNLNVPLWDGINDEQYLHIFKR